MPSETVPQKKVRYSYLPQQFADPEPVFEEIRRLIQSGNYTLGAQVAQFEQAFARVIGVKHAIGVASGTDSLMLGLKALGIGHGDEVITAANTFIATVGAINAAGARPVLVDVTPYFTIDPERIEAAITPHTKAIMPVHITGEACDMDRIEAIAKKHHLPIVEDACQSILCEFNGQKAGTFGAAAGFSLHPLKNLNVWGDAGVVVTNRDDLNETLRLLRNHGLKNRDEIEILGYNSRLDTLQAIVGNSLVGQVGDITARRIQNAARYDAGFKNLSGQITLPPRRANVKRVYHLYMVQAYRRDALLRFLEENGIEAKVHYPIPLPWQRGLRHLGYKPGDFPETERQAREFITFPVDQHLRPDEIDYVIEKVHEFYKSV